MLGSKSWSSCHQVWIQCRTTSHAFPIPFGSKSSMATLKDQLIVNLLKEKQSRQNKIMVTGLVLLAWPMPTVS